MRVPHLDSPRDTGSLRQKEGPSRESRTGATFHTSALHEDAVTIIVYGFLSGSFRTDIDPEHGSSKKTSRLWLK